MQDYGPFGDPQMHYASRGRQTPPVLTPEEKLLKRKLGREVKSAVRRACRVWGQTVRDSLRTETALYLVRNEAAKETVRVDVVDGVPPHLRPYLHGVNEEDWEFVLKRWLLRFTSDGLKFVDDRYDYVRKMLWEQREPASKCEVERVKKLIDDILAKMHGADLVHRILREHSDVLGAYFFNESRIEMYWMVIGLVARSEGIDLDGLTVTVLCHELAHAYTHLGFDTASGQWNTKAFADADLSIVEGLAQFYTGAVAERVRPRSPSVEKAFKALLRLQEGPYLAHLGWSEKDENAGEAVRHAMVETRSQELIHHSEFLKSLDAARKEVGRRHKAPKKPPAKPDPDFDPEPEAEDESDA